MIVALAYKELHQHLPSVLGVAVLFSASALIALGMALTLEQGTLLGAASSLAYYGLPMVVAFVLRRLVVLEYSQGTHDFLAALPGTAMVRSLVKYVMGWFVVQVAAVGALLFVAVVVSQQELIGWGFLAQVTAQIVVYVWAWYGLTFFAAHLGRYRSAFWLLLLPAVLTLGEMEPDVYELYLWQASLQRPLDEVRTAVPWRALGVSFVWATSLSVVGLLLSTVQQGARVAGWFSPMSAREKTSLVVLVFASWLALDVIDDMPLFGGPVYEGLPAVHESGAVVRVAGARDSDLWQVGERVADKLDGLNEVVGTDWPTLVLVPVLQEADRPVDVRSEEHGELVLEVDMHAPRAEVLRSVLDWVFTDRSSTYIKRRPDRAWIAMGAPRYLMGGPNDGAFALRAAIASRQITSADELANSLEIEHRLGSDVAAAVGWVGLTVLRDHAGDSAVNNIISSVFAPVLKPTLFGAMRTHLQSGDGLVRYHGKLEPEAFRQAWLHKLRELEVQHAAQIDAFGDLDGEVSRVQGEEAGVVLGVQMPGAPAPDLEVAWVELDPLHTRPMLHDEWETRSITTSQQRVPTPVDPRDRLAMRFIRYIPELEGSVVFGLTVEP